MMTPVTDGVGYGCPVSHAGGRRDAALCHFDVIKCPSVFDKFLIFPNCSDDNTVAGKTDCPVRMLKRDWRMRDSCMQDCVESVN